MRKRPFVEGDPAERNFRWECDGIDPGWFHASGIGAIRSARSYKPGGWWFLPEWLPDTEEYDVGPFRSKADAVAAAEAMARARQR